VTTPPLAALDVSARTVSSGEQLRQVAAWELRRLAASRISWLAGGVALGCFGFILVARNRWPLTDVLVLSGGTTSGQLAELAYDLAPFLGIILSFVTVDAVAVDYQQRTYELLMTSAVPSWVYVVGRYLARLVVSLGLAILLLVAQIGVNVGLAQLNPADPSPQLAANLVLWGALVVPATVTLASLGVALGAVLPRHSVVPKVVLSIAWVILSLDNDPRDLGWRDYWNPTSAGVAKVLLLRLAQQSRPLLAGLPIPAPQVARALQLQEQPLDLAAWLGPFAALVVLGVLLVVATAMSFRRFRSPLE
jgi:hypothetical protein